MSYYQPLYLVEQFHGAAELQDLIAPGIPGDETTRLRVSLMHEELDEYVAAAQAGDSEGVLDALCDLTYVVMGTVLAHGMGDVFLEAFEEVHRSNMAKVGPPIRRREDGKILKPAGWTPPNLKQFVDGSRPPGRATVEHVFKSSKHGNIAALMVREGSIKRDDLLTVQRNGEPITSRTEIQSLRRFKSDVKKVHRNYECGIALVGFDDFRKGDEVIVWPRKVAERGEA